MRRRLTLVRGVINTPHMDCICDGNKKCLFHARQPRPCPCGGTLEYFAGKDGGRLVPFALTTGGYAMEGFAQVVERRVGAMWACNRCENCEAA